MANPLSFLRSIMKSKVAGDVSKAALSIPKAVINPGSAIMHETMDALWSPASIAQGFYSGFRKGTFLKGLGAATDKGAYIGSRMQAWNPMSIGPISTVTKTAGFAVGTAARFTVKPVAQGLNVAGGYAFRGGVALTNEAIREIPGAINLVGGALAQTARLGHMASNHPLGSFTMGWGALAGFGAYGVLNAADDNTEPKAVSPYQINPYATPGLEDDARFAPKLINKDAKDFSPSVARQGRVDNLGADGDLVFAMHNSRNG